MPYRVARRCRMKIEEAFGAGQEAMWSTAPQTTSSVTDTRTKLVERMDGVEPETVGKVLYSTTCIGVSIRDAERH
jgi:hypothetical protein